MGIEKFPPHALSLMRWLLVEPRFSFGTPLIVYKNVVLETEHDDKFKIWRRMMSIVDCYGIAF